MDDGALLTAWRAGDADAGRTLFDRHFAALYRFFRNQAGDEAEDLVQDTFLALVRSQEPFRGEASFRTYLFQAARSRLLDRARAWGRRGEVVDLSVRSVADLRPGAFTELGRQGEERLLLAGLRQLPVETQALLALHFFEQLTGPELAAVFEVPEGTVRSRLRLGREALRKALERVSADPDLIRSTCTDLEGWARRAGASLIG